VLRTNKRASAIIPHGDSGVRADIEAVFRSLPLRAGIDERLGHTVALLGRIATANPPPDTAFRRVGRRQCEAELRALANAAEMLVKAIDSLHEPTILALAAPSIVWLARGGLRRLAQQAANAARQADVNRVPLNCPRQPQNRRSPLVASYLAKEYETFTGKRPTVRTRNGAAYGPFLELVRDVFRAMSIDDSAEAAARKAVRRR